MKPPHAASRRHLPGSPFNVPVVTAPPKTFAIDDQVTHDRFGMGRVIGVEEGVAVLVDFGRSEERIVAPYHKLTKL